MPKYINADDLIAEYKDKIGFNVAKVVKNFPAADVRENIHGEWVPSDLDENFKVCSVCKNKGYKDRMAWRQDYIKAYLKFCPNCGADNRPRTTSADMRGWPE